MGQSDESAFGSSQPASSNALSSAAGSEGSGLDLQGIGNSIGNIISSGLIASAGGWVYYNSAPFSDKNESALYKAKTDGSGKVKLSDDSPYFINVIGEWIFYVNSSDDHKIYRIKTDGTEKTALTEKAVWSMMVIDNWIYFSQQYDSDKLRKISVDGTANTVIGNGEPELLCIGDEWIYYYNDEDKSIYKIKTDGSGKMQLTTGDITYFTIADGWLYYALDDVDTLNKVKIDGSGQTKLADSFRGGLLMAEGGKLYYLSSGALFSMNTDGTGRSQIFKDEMRTLNFADDWFYYSKGSDEKYYRVKPDGTGKELFGG